MYDSLLLSNKVRLVSSDMEHVAEGEDAFNKVVFYDETRNMHNSVDTFNMQFKMKETNVRLEFILAMQKNGDLIALQGGVYEA